MYYPVVAFPVVFSAELYSATVSDSLCQSPGTLWWYVSPPCSPPQCTHCRAHTHTLSLSLRTASMLSAACPSPVEWQFTQHTLEKKQIVSNWVGVHSWSRAKEKLPDWDVFRGKHLLSSSFSLASKNDKCLARHIDSCMTASVRWTGSCYGCVSVGNQEGARCQVKSVAYSYTGMQSASLCSESDTDSRNFCWFGAGKMYRDTLSILRFRVIS